MASRPIRVLHLRDSPWVDGPGRTIVETAAHLDPAKIEYHVGVFIASDTQDHPLVEALQSRGASVHKIADQRGISRQTIDATVQLARHLKIDVLHTSEFKSNALALLCKRQLDVKVVTTAHGWIANDLRGKIYRTFDKVLLRWFDGVILVSNAMRRLVPRWWLPDRRSCVVQNALVLGSYGAAIVDAPRRPIDVTKSVKLLNVGRLSPEKGQDLLLRALAVVSPECPALRLQIAGVGPMEGQLRELAASLGIADKVDFLGYIADMPGLYSQIDVLVQSSFTEGMPNAILEAAYLRVPVIATRVGGTDEVVEHGRSAWLLPPGNVEPLVEGIRNFLRDPQTFVQMAHAAHVRVRTNFSFAARTDKLTQFYEALCVGL